MNEKGMKYGILDRVQSGPATTTEIFEALKAEGFRRNSLVATLSTLRSEGYLIGERSAGRGREYRWRLAPDHPPLESPPARARTRILDAVAQEPATTMRLAERVGLSYWTTHNHIQALIAQCKLRRVDCAKSDTGRTVAVWGLA